MEYSISKKADADVLVELKSICSVVTDFKWRDTDDPVITTSAEMAPIEAVALSGYFKRRDYIRDSRPTTLAELKADAVVSVDAKTRALIAAGFTFDGKQFSLSAQAQANWMGLYVFQALFSWPMNITTQDDQQYSLSLANLIPFVAGGSGRVAWAVGTGRALKLAINAAQTQEELDAVVDTR